MVWPPTAPLPWSAQAADAARPRTSAEAERIRNMKRSLSKKGPIKRRQATGSGLRDRDLLESVGVEREEGMVLGGGDGDRLGLGEADPRDAADDRLREGLVQGGFDALAARLLDGTDGPRNPGMGGLRRPAPFAAARVPGPCLLRTAARVRAAG